MDARERLEALPVKRLREVAAGMPYRGEATKREIIDWLCLYAPDRVADTLRSMTDGTYIARSIRTRP